MAMARIRSSWLPAAAVLAALALAIQQIPQGSALVTTSNVVRSNQRWVALDSFGFLPGGQAEVNASDLSIYLPEQVSSPDLSLIGFALAGDSESEWLQQNPQSVDDPAPADCPLSGPNVTRIFSAKDIGQPGADGKRPTKAGTASVEAGGLQTLYLMNCAPATLVSVRVTAALYNAGPGRARLYLPAGQISLAITDFVCAAILLIVAILWLRAVLQVWCQAARPPRFQVYLTLLLPVLIALSSTFAAALLQRQSYGLSPVLDWVSDVLLILSGLTLLAAFLSGLDHVDSYLTDIERSTLFVSIPLWLVCQLGLAFSTGSPLLEYLAPPGAPVEGSLRPLLQAGVFMALCIMAVLLALEVLAQSCSYFVLRGRGRRDDREEEGLFGKFYIVICAFVLLTSGAYVILNHFLPYYLAWLGDAVCHVMLLLFVAYTLWRVRPRLEKSVYQLFDESDGMDEELDEL